MQAFKGVEKKTPLHDTRLEMQENEKRRGEQTDEIKSGTKKKKEN